jgi:hypothetical protein
LTADDSLMIRTLLRDILTSAGHEIVGEPPGAATRAHPRKTASGYCAR